MFRSLFACVVLAAGLLVAGSTIRSTEPTSADPAGCGLCTAHSDCGTGHRCCHDSCDKGRYRCLMVSTCP